MTETISDTAFEALATQLRENGVDKVFDALAEQLRAEQKYHELFDARLMQNRHKLGIPVILTESLEELPEPLATQIHDSHLVALNEVGDLFLAEERLPEAWMYLRHTDRKPDVVKVLESSEPDEESVEDWINIAVHEGVAPKRGFEIVLEHHGTCNAVTMFEGAAGQLNDAQRSEVAGLLVSHLHDELLQNLISEVAREEGGTPAEKTIADLVADREWLFENDAYHIDTSHLGMVIRFARFVTDVEKLKQARDLCAYGRHLSSQFQYEGEEPFVDLYESHSRFFAVQIGDDADNNLCFFEEKATTPNEHGSLPAEAYVCLLCRLEQFAEAFAMHRKLIPQNAQTMGLCPSMMELAQLASDFVGLREVCRERGNRVGFVASLVQEHLNQKPEK